MALHPAPPRLIAALQIASAGIRCMRAATWAPATLRFAPATDTRTSSYGTIASTCRLQKTRPMSHATLARAAHTAWRKRHFTHFDTVAYPTHPSSRRPVALSTRMRSSLGAQELRGPCGKCTGTAACERAFVSVGRWGRVLGRCVRTTNARDACLSHSIGGHSAGTLTGRAMSEVCTVGWAADAA